MSYILGVDEAGRGPLAGPVAVGAVLAPDGYDFLFAFPGLNDSKQLSEAKREELFNLLEANSEVRFSVQLVSAAFIDQEGISRGVAGATAQAVSILMPDPSAGRVYLDGLLAAPMAYEQETIVRGDETVPAIMLASVAAKVTRDRLMMELAKQYPAYGFEQHKGYGTKKHREAIGSHGLCDLHRRSFCRNVA